MLSGHELRTMGEGGGCCVICCLVLEGGSWCVSDCVWDAGALPVIPYWGFGWRLLRYVHWVMRWNEEWGNGGNLWIGGRGLRRTFVFGVHPSCFRM